MTLEGCVVRISDIVAYLGRDIEDAIRLGRFNIKDIPQDFINHLGTTNSTIINHFVNDIIENSFNKNYIALSEEMFKLLKDLKKFNYDNIYSKSNTPKQINQYKLMFETVFNYSLEALNKENKNASIYKVFLNGISEAYLKNTTKERMVIDFIAGMTDEYLVKQFNYIKELTIEPIL
jgi:dGTPase